MAGSRLHPCLGTCGICHDNLLCDLGYGICFLSFTRSMRSCGFLRIKHLFESNAACVGWTRGWMDLESCRSASHMCKQRRSVPEVMGTIWNHRQTKISARCKCTFSWTSRRAATLKLGDGVYKAKLPNGSRCGKHHSFPMQGKRRQLEHICKNWQRQGEMQRYRHPSSSCNPT